ncbi:MAG: phosphatidate cytidylyltransferase [Thermoguttaceae bacterium]|jgi:phosphatidate cytidylyltransferase|nr:phosphatidate cytidylyltransferase [Thermoguttaceae bacterium]
MPDARTLALLGGVLLLLAAAAGAVRFLRSRTDSGLDAAVLQTLGHRVRFWFLLFLVLAGAFLLGRTATTVMFGLLAFWALREFITLTPTRPGDHRTLFWVFFLIPLLQFVLVGLDCYELYSILIPVFAFLLLPAHIALAGDYKRFLERTAKIEAGLLICVYSLSFAPAMLTLSLPGEDPYAGTRLLLFFLLIAQLGDAMQYAWAQLPSKHVIVPTINPHRTWEGLLGGAGTVTLLGAALWWATPFSGHWWWMAGVMALVTALMGFAGAITMSAIKRDRGVKDYGTLVEGHGGLLDRIDSICFAAPVFFFLTKFWLAWFGAGQTG